MRIIFTRRFYDTLGEIESFIANDSQNRAKAFHDGLIDSIKSLEFMPKRCRKSAIFDDENIRELIFKGYVVVFRLVDDEIRILYIYKHNLPKIKDEK